MGKRKLPWEESPLDPTPGPKKQHRPTKPTSSPAQKKKKPSDPEFAPKPPRRRKKPWSGAKPMGVPEEGKIFKGLVFCLIPNDAMTQRRELRVQRAHDFGGTCEWFESDGWVAKEPWMERVTHLIVEPDIDYPEVLRLLSQKCSLPAIPNGVKLVNSNWIPDCIIAKRLENVDRLQHRVLYHSQAIYDLGPIYVSPQHIDNDNELKRICQQLSKQFSTVTLQSVHKARVILSRVADQQSALEELRRYGMESIDMEKKVPPEDIVRVVKLQWFYEIEQGNLAPLQNFCCLEGKVKSMLSN